MLAAALLIFNTIRMAIFARRREIEVMKLVGATNWFIRIPFMLEGLVQGLLGAGVRLRAVYFLRNGGRGGLRRIDLFQGFVVLGSQVATTGTFTLLSRRRHRRRRRRRRRHPLPRRLGVWARRSR